MERKTMTEAREAFYAEPSNSTAAEYIIETLQHYTDRFNAELDDNFYLYRTAGEVGYWLKFDRIDRMPHPKHPE